MSERTCVVCGNPVEPNVGSEGKPANRRGQPAKKCLFHRTSGPKLYACKHADCSNLFLKTPKAPLSYCGPECRTAARTKSTGEYRARNRARLNAQNRAYMAARYTPYRTIIRCKTEGCCNLYLLRSGRAGYCGPECRRAASNEAAKRYAARNPEKRRSYQIMKHGITVAEYEAMLALQGEACAVCKTTEPGGPFGTWGIDHDHLCCPGPLSCGECVRGIVCDRCNKGMGVLSDDPELLRSAADYIESRRQLRVVA